MPESKVRRKKSYTPPVTSPKVVKPNAAWFAPTMVTFLLVGLYWVVVFYVSQSKYPIPHIGAANILIGFGIMMVGFGMLTRWR